MKNLKKINALLGVFFVFCAICLQMPKLNASYASHKQGSAIHEEHPTNEKGHDKHEFKIQNLIFNHINNSNEFHIAGDLSIPLPCILYSKTDGFTTFLSSKLNHGHTALNRFVSDHGVVKRVMDSTFPTEEVEVGAITHKKIDGIEIANIEYQGKQYELEAASNLFKFTSFIDFSISKNVMTMLLVSLLMIFIFLRVSKAYKIRTGLAPHGAQNFFEVIVSFIIDEAAKPMLGDRYLRFTPFLLTIFFFILFCNLFGLIPFAPFGANVTGNISTTLALALITFIITNILGNKSYWEHILWMPGVPWPIKLFLAPIELIGIFTKPISLMIRLFANITAGHIIIISLIGLIFVFGKIGASIGGATVGVAVAVPFTIFMNLIELVVALIQAFIFTILTASYLGASTEESHHEGAHH